MSSQSVLWGFPGGSVVNTPPASAGDKGLLPGWGRSLGEGNGYPVHIIASEIPCSLACYSPWGHKRVGRDFVTQQQ